MGQGAGSHQGTTLPPEHSCPLSTPPRVLSDNGHLVTDPPTRPKPRPHLESKTVTRGDDDDGERLFYFTGGTGYVRGPSVAKGRQRPRTTEAAEEAPPTRGRGQPRGRPPTQTSRGEGSPAGAHQPKAEGAAPRAPTNQDGRGGQPHGRPPTPKKVRAKPRSYVYAAAGGGRAQRTRSLSQNGVRSQLASDNDDHGPAAPRGARRVRGGPPRAAARMRARRPSQRGPVIQGAGGHQAPPSHPNTRVHCKLHQGFSQTMDT